MKYAIKPSRIKSYNPRASPHPSIPWSTFSILAMHKIRNHPISCSCKCDGTWNLCYASIYKFLYKIQWWCLYIYLRSSNQLLYWIKLGVYEARKGTRIKIYRVFYFSLVHPSFYSQFFSLHTSNMRTLVILWSQQRRRTNAETDIDFSILDIA